MKELSPVFALFSSRAAMPYLPRWPTCLCVF